MGFDTYFWQQYIFPVTLKINNYLVTTVIRQKPVLKMRAIQSMGLMAEGETDDRIKSSFSIIFL